MRAIVHDQYGGPEVLRLLDLDKPSADDDQLLVKVHSAAVHPGDWLLMTGQPILFRPAFGFRGPRKRIPGFDFAGTVEAVGPNVTGFAAGDEVFGDAAGGSCAEYVSVSEVKVAAKPVNITLAQAAVVAVSGTTALRGLRDAGDLKPGQHVLINGASGGVGTFAVQIAKALGAHVTGVCSTGNAELVRSIGADHVIDYTTDDFTEGGARYDLILDNVANHSLADCNAPYPRTASCSPTTAPRAVDGSARWVEWLLPPRCHFSCQRRAGRFMRRSGNRIFSISRT